MTLRYSTDLCGNYTQNFYADVSGNLGTQYLGTGQSVSAWLTANSANTTYAYVTKWYNQGMDLSFNSATQYTLGSQPVYEVANGLINFGYTTGYTPGTNLPSWSANAGNAYFNLPNGALPYNDSSFSYIMNFANVLSGSLYSAYVSGGTATNYHALILWTSNAAVANSVQTWNWQSSNFSATTSYKPLTFRYTSTGTSTPGVYTSNLGGGATVTNTNTVSSIRLQDPTYNAIGVVTMPGYGSASYINSQMYELFISNIAVNDTDRALLESAPCTYSALASITGLATTSVTATTFTTSWTAYTNATLYTIFVNGALYGTSATNSITVTPGYNGPWTVNVYAYNSSNVLLASGPLTVPAQITSLAASVITSNGCTLSWSGGVGTGVSYTITYSPAAASAPSTASSSPVTVTNLAVNTAYTITLNAVVGGSTINSATVNVNTFATTVAVSNEIQNIVMGSNATYYMDSMGINDAGTKVVGGNASSGAFFYIYYNGSSWSTPATFSGANTNSYYTGALTADGTRGVIGNAFFTWTGTTPSALTSFGTAPSGGRSYTKLTADGSRLLMQSNGTMGFYTWNGSTYANFVSLSSLTNLTTTSAIAISPTGTYIAYSPNSTSKSIYFATWNGTTYAGETLNMSTAYNTNITPASPDMHDMNFGDLNVLYVAIAGIGGFSNVIALGYNSSTGYFDKYFGLKTGVGAPSGGVAATRLSNTGTLMANFNGYFYNWQLTVT